VHKVKVLAVHPLVLDVVDHELEIRWDPRGLDWTEVNSNDGSTGEFIGDLNGQLKEWIMRGICLPSIAQMPVPVARSIIF
jgi:hypothetical protein